MLHLMCVASALALPLNGNLTAWKAEFGKTYDTVESEAIALKAYIQNDHIIEEHNAPSSSPKQCCVTWECKNWKCPCDQGCECSNPPSGPYECCCKSSSPFGKSSSMEQSFNSSDP
eukprot:CAMPEP_0174720448 /NCGR_PEP_ID=MMETSP1094-20130205/33570_1 /TAXON_ID=156173 /ORGANISM="Chrysochromulina brevifilum, Strain UTEX LB 985" /LENGTH=115 /DNA_ID=CAMNT_0015920929 /DNA_START=24 /DNA_END=371 /DNA_ORIENTATION=+